jgi:pterin-4a-carbinolamine dehydratase
MSDDWAERIRKALASATLLMPVIGPSWLSVADQHRKRRIDNADDWVRNEIRHALQSKLRILPVLLSKTPMPERAAFPDAIADLARFQGFELRDDRWEGDLALLLTRMQELGFRRVSSQNIRYPVPRVSLHELTEKQLRDALKRLPEWQAVTSDLPGSPGLVGSEIHRAYEFASFEDAMAFMSAAVGRIGALDHHPRWENVWRTVSVWLSTWDIGHKPSALDIELATYLDRLRRDFAPARRSASRRFT